MTPALNLPGELADRLHAWNQARPPGGSTDRPALRKHVKRGLEAARLLARHLGPAWVVRHWDEQHRTVEGEYKWLPLRAEGFGDFAPDDPAAALGLCDDLVAALYQWAKDIDAAMERQSTERVARELGPGRVVTYGGIG